MASSVKLKTIDKNSACPICNGECSLLDVMDLNKSCAVQGSKIPALTGIPVYYSLCSQCSFCFAPELAAWSLEQFEEHIYNDEYVHVDPEYLEVRPKANAANLIAMFKDKAHSIRHLDYGGGSGVLANILNESGWQSVSYDPFVDRNVEIEQLGKFDIITSYEVFEHVPDAQELMANLASLLSPNGIILFSTLLSDGNIQPNQRINWWYAAPRNGHISLYSRKSLELLAQKYGFNLGSFSAGFHIFFTQVAPWTSHLFPKK